MLWAVTSRPGLGRARPRLSPFYSPARRTGAESARAALARGAHHISAIPGGKAGSGALKPADFRGSGPGRDAAEGRAGARWARNGDDPQPSPKVNHALSDRGRASIRERECATAPRPSAPPGAPVHGAQAKCADAHAGD